MSASPSEVVSELWRRLDAEDYSGAAELHTKGFAEHSASRAWREATPRPRRPRIAEELLELDPDMPAEVAAWEAEQSREQPSPTPYFGEVFGVETKAELEALTPTEILARRLQAADWRSWLRPHLAELSEKHPAYREQLEQQSREARSQWRGRVVGHVVDGSRAYVIVQGNPVEVDDGQPVDWGPDVVTLRASDVGWRVSCDLTTDSHLVHFHIVVEDENGRQVVLS